MAAGAMQRQIDDMGARIGFEVDRSRLWRRGRYVVVAEARTVDASPFNDLPDRIALFRSEGFISDDDLVAGVYVYEQWTDAMRQLWETFSVQRGMDQLRVFGLEALHDLVEQIEVGSLEREDACRLFFATPGVVSGPTAGM